MSGRRVALTVEDPWTGARTNNRRALGDFVATLSRLGIAIEEAKIVWNPVKSSDDPATQRNELSAALKPHVAAVKLSPYDGRTSHFHDRVVTMRTVDSGAERHARWDVTAGIDNLMSRSKDCSLILERLDSVD